MHASFHIQRNLCIFENTNKWNVLQCANRENQSGITMSFKSHNNPKQILFIWKGKSFASGALHFPINQVQRLSQLRCVVTNMPKFHLSRKHFFFPMISHRGKITRISPLSRDSKRVGRNVTPVEINPAMYIWPMTRIESRSQLQSSRWWINSTNTAHNGNVMRVYVGHYRYKHVFGSQNFIFNLVHM